MRPSRHATVIAWTIFAVLLSPIIATAGFSDNLSNFDRPARPVSLRTGSDPNVSRLFFMPTFEVAPQGQTSVGTTELVAVHGSFSPLDFAQIGISTIPWLPGSVSVGAKVRVVRSRDQKAGIAVGGNYTSLHLDFTSDALDRATTGYVVAGYNGERGQVHGALFYIETQEHRHVYYSPPPPGEDSYLPSNKKTEHAVLGVLGFSAPVHGTTSALLELWGIGSTEDWPLVLPGFRFYENNTSFEAIVLPAKRDEGKWQVTVPIFNVTHHFR